MNRYLVIVCVLALYSLAPSLRADYVFPAAGKPAQEDAIGYDEREADRYVRTIDAWTTLTLAVLRGDRASAEAMLRGGEDVNTRDRFGRSLVLLATAYDLEEMVDLLGRHGANVNLGDSSNRTPLIVAVTEGNLKLAEALLAHGADPNLFRTNDRGKVIENALHLAANSGPPAMARLLLERGAAVDAVNSFNQTALHLAAHEGRTEVVQILLDHGADPNRNDGSRTPLREAVDQGQLETARLLLERGARPDDPDGYGWNPLCSAVNRGQPDLVKALLEHGARVNDKTKKGETPLDLARKPEVIALLKHAGAMAGVGKTQSPPPKPVKGKPAFTKVLFTSPGFTTASQPASPASLDALHYRIEAECTINEGATNDRRKLGGTAPVYNISYYLELEGCTPRIGFDTNEGGGLRDLDQNPISLHWLDKGRVIDLCWIREYLGTGAIEEENHLLLMVKDRKVERLLQDTQELRGKDGFTGGYSGNMHFDWNAKNQELSVVHYSYGGEWMSKPTPLCEVTDPDLPESDSSWPYCSVGHFKRIWRYRLEGDKLRYLGGEKYLYAVNGRPAVDVSPKHSIPLSKLRSMNPSLAGKVFCDRKVLLDDQLKPPEER